MGPGTCGAVMSTVLFSPRSGGIYSVRWSYDPALVDLLKTVVPGHSRSWDPDAKEWTIAAQYAQRLASLVVESGHRVLGLQERPSGSRDQTAWARDLLTRVGAARREAVLLAFVAFGVHNLQSWLERWEHEWHLDGRR